MLCVFELQLQRLLLDSNQLKNFPAEILQKCAQLQTLSLHSNELTMDDLREVTISLRNCLVTIEVPDRFLVDYKAWQLIRA